MIAVRAVRHATALLSASRCAPTSTCRRSDLVIVAAPRRPVLPAGRLLHRPVAAGRRARSSPTRTPTMRGAATAATWPRRRPRACCARGSAPTSRCRRWPTARRSSITACASACTRPATCSARRRCALEHGGQVWVASGDYFVSRRRPTTARGQRTCAPFEPVRCHCFITESTFGLPIYRWRAAGRAVRRRSTPGGARNAEAGRASLLLGYSFGKAQRILAGVDRVDRADRRARRGRAAEPRLSRRRRRRCRRRCWSPTSRTRPMLRRALVRRAAVGAGLASGRGASATRSDAFASGWMQLRGARRRRGVDRGFVLSDHADWPGLQRAIARHRRRARDRHPRLRGGDGALARRAGPARRRPSRPSTATTTTRPIAHRRDGQRRQSDGAQ